MEPVLQNRLKKIKEKKLVRLHYPGHKGREGGFPPQELFSLDMTETYGTDNLLKAEEIIKESQEMAAKTFGTLNTYYGVGGSTMALYASIYAMAKEGQEILVQRNCHKSVYQGAMLRNLKIRTIDPDYDEENGLLLGLQPHHLQIYLKENPETKALVLTNPSYYGVMQDLKSLIDIAHSYGVLVLVDEAHGGHLPFSHLKEYSALNCGADLVVHSAHKSLAAVTQTALLHRNSHRISHENIQEKISLFTSSSPSYIFLLSIEASICKIAHWEKGKKKDFLNNLQVFRQKAKALGYHFYEPAIDKNLVAYDFMKIFFSYPGYSGEELSEELYKRGINLELSDGAYVLGVLSQNTEKEDLERLLEAMSTLEKGTKTVKKGIYKQSKRRIAKEVQESYSCQGQWLELDKAIHKISNNYIYQYPPGVPLVLPGEVLTEEIVAILKEGTGLVGLKGNQVRVI